MTATAAVQDTVLATEHPEALLRITVHGRTVQTETGPDTRETWNSICALTRLGFRVTVQPLD